MGAGCLLDVESVSPSPAYWSYLHPDLMRAEMKSQYRSDCLMEMERDAAICPAGNVNMETRESQTKYSKETSLEIHWMYTLHTHKPHMETR